MTSNVGAPNVYEDGDQRNIPQFEIEQQKKDNRFHEGQQNSHKANDASKQILPEKERLLANIAVKKTSELLLIDWLGKRKCVMANWRKTVADVL